MSRLPHTGTRNRRSGRVIRGPRQFHHHHIGYARAAGACAGAQVGIVRREQGVAISVGEDGGIAPE